LVKGFLSNKRFNLITYNENLGLEKHTEFENHSTDTHADLLWYATHVISG